MHFILLFFILIVPRSVDLPALIVESKYQLIDKNQQEVTRINIDSKTRIYLNGKKRKFEDVPEGAEIELIKFAKDMKTILEIRFILKINK